MVWFGTHFLVGFAGGAVFIVFLSLRYEWVLRWRKTIALAVAVIVAVVALVVLKTRLVQLRGFDLRDD